MVVPSWESLERHPDLGRLLRRDPTPPLDRRQLLHAAVALLLVVALGAGLVAASAAFCLPLVLVPVAMALFIVFHVVRGLAEHARERRAALERFPALVSELSTTMAGPHAPPADRVLLELRDGSRRELDCPEELADRLREGALGIAYLRGGILVDFIELAR